MTFFFSFFYCFCVVVPLDVSDVVRRFIESLFITHTEAKLNTSGQLLRADDETTTNNDQDNETIDRTSSEPLLKDRGEWCRNIVFRHYQ